MAACEAIYWIAADNGKIECFLNRLKYPVVYT